MSIESEIFKRMTFDSTKLLNYGFIKEQNVYKYSKEFLQNSFRVEITIYDDQTVKGKIYDLDLNDEYISFRVESQIGEFVNKVREEYKNILKGIKGKYNMIRRIKHLYLCYRTLFSDFISM